MTRILNLVDRLDYHALARQLRDLLPVLRARGQDHRVVVLEEAGPWQGTLERAGIPVEVLHHRWTTDLRPLFRLRALRQQFAPKIVHAWGLGALRWAALSGGGGTLMATPALTGSEHRSWGASLHRRLLKRADRLLALGETERQRLLAFGGRPEQVVLAAPGIALPQPAVPVELEGLPAEAHVILCVGSQVQRAGFLDSLWALDILRYIYADLHLILVGTGPERHRLERFARRIVGTRFVHFAGEQEDLGPWLARADVVWSPGRVETGLATVLEAMAMGRPVIAGAWPRLAELIVEGETGFLVRSGDKVALARQTRLLLENESLRQRLGEAGRQRVADHFSLARLAEVVTEMYRG